MHYIVPERGTGGNVGTILPQEQQLSNNVDHIYILESNHHLVQVSNPQRACSEFKHFW